MDLSEFGRFAAGGETLPVEFKSEVSDADLIEAVVCLANADDGDLSGGEPPGLFYLSSELAAGNYYVVS